MPRYTPPVEPVLTKAQLNKKVVEKNKQLQKNNSDLTKSAKSLESKTKELKSQVDSIKKELASEKQKKSSISKSVKAISGDLDKAQAKLSSKGTELAKLNDEFASLSIDYNKKEQMLNRIYENIEQSKKLKEKIAPLKKEKEKLESDISLQKLNLSDLSDQEKSIEDRIKALETDYEKAKAPYVEKIELIKQKASEFVALEEDELLKLKDIAVKESERISRIRSKCQAVEKKIKNLEGLIEDKIVELEDLQGTVDGLKRDETVLKRNIENTKERYAGWKTKSLDEVAKLKLKGKLENIDKAGLREILDNAL